MVNGTIVEKNTMIIMMIEVNRQGITDMIKRITVDMINTIIHIIKVIKIGIGVNDEIIGVIVMRESAAVVDFHRTKMVDAVKMNMIMDMIVDGKEIQNITKKVIENTLMVLHMVVRMEQHLIIMVIIIRRRLKAAHRHRIININHRYRKCNDCIMFKIKIMMVIFLEILEPTNHRHHQLIRGQLRVLQNPLNLIGIPLIHQKKQRNPLR